MYRKQPQKNPNAVGIPDTNTDIQKLIILCQQSGLTRVPEIASALEFLLENPDDSQLLELVQEGLAQHTAQQIIDPDPFRATNPICSDGLEGPVKLGFTEHGGIKYGISPDELVTNLLIVGRTGGGKTCLALLLLSQILELRKPCS